MEQLAFKARFDETYFFASAVKNILNDRYVYLRKLEEFYGDGSCLAFVKPYPRYSAFHCFIEFVVEAMMSNENTGVDLEKMQTVFRNHASFPAALEELRPKSLPIDEAMHQHEIDHESFDEWLVNRGKSFVEATPDDVCDYYLDLQLQAPYQRLIEQIVREVFFVLFQNRRLLLLFNQMMADQLEGVEKEDLPTEDRGFLKSSGVLKRVTPRRWVQKAVYHRDRGRCTICRRDLTGILSISGSSSENYDHIVPLARGGLNDVTNIQLLCKDCNRQKLHHKAITSDYYEDWYEADLHDGV